MSARSTKIQFLSTRRGTRAGLAALCGLAALVPVVSAARSPHRPVAAAAPVREIAVLDIRNAPVRQALEMVLTEAGAQYSIDNRVTGTVTMYSSTFPSPLENTLAAVCRASTTPLVYTRDTSQGVVYFVNLGPATAQRRTLTPPSAAAPAPPAPPFSDPVRVPRRVAGVLLVRADHAEDTAAARAPMAYAILETGVSFAAGTDVRVVHAGDSVPSGVPGIDDLHVTLIDARGVTLETSDKATQIRVPLSDGNAGKN